MGWGSAGTPPWQDDKAIDEEKHNKRDSDRDAKINQLEKENQKLRKRLKELEKELRELKK